MSKFEKLYEKARAAALQAANRAVDKASAKAAGKTYTVHGHFESRGNKSAFWTKTGLSRSAAQKLAAEQRRESGGVARVVPE